MKTVAELLHRLRYARDLLRAGDRYGRDAGSERAAHVLGRVPNELAQVAGGPSPELVAKLLELVRAAVFEYRRALADHGDAAARVVAARHVEHELGPVIDEIDRAAPPAGGAGVAIALALWVLFDSPAGN